MEHKYLLDVNVVLDYLLDRLDVSPRIYDLFLKFHQLKTDLYISSSQIHTISFMFLKEAKKSRSLDIAKTELDLFMKSVKIVKTPSYVDIKNTLFVQDSEDYLIELSAKIAGAMIITRDERFLNSSKLTISIEDFLNNEEIQKNQIPFLDL
ncbi:MAG: hypothetical protein IE880_09040, partial [Epsilonproteobacteria bacterium]|nr:hypothetical protein [Campylobacterota bacterium]